MFDRLLRRLDALEDKAPPPPARVVVIQLGGIAATPEQDLYDRRLDQLRIPTLVLHGADDPRTEPGELDRLRREVPHAEIHMLPGAGHSPHSERASRERCVELATAFSSAMPI